MRISLTYQPLLGLLMIFAFLIVHGFANAQNNTNEFEVKPYSLSNTEVRFLSSKNNGVAYKLYVSLPADYESTSQNYPVLYLLDADYSFAIATNIVNHLTQRNHLMPVIIVGIAYAGENKYRLHRTRDYTPTNSEEPVSFQDIQNQYSGGGPAFSDFIEYELIPFVDTLYRVNGHRALTGHSYGGLFTAWTLLTKPALFDKYIVVSPSLWYDDRLLFRIEENLSGYKGKEIKAYFAVGDREINQYWNMPERLEDFVTKLKAMNLKNLEIKHGVGANETHNSIFPYALSNGIRFVFEGN